MCFVSQIRQSKRQAWDLSAMAADQALQLDVEERKKVYTFRYRDLPGVAKKSEVNAPLSAAAVSIKSPPSKPAAITKRKNSSTAERKTAKKPKFTSVKSVNNQSSLNATSKDDSPFEFNEPGM